MSCIGGKAEVGAENAERFVSYSKKFAKIYSRFSPAGYLSIPCDLSRIPGGKPSLDGGEPYLIAFGDAKLLADEIPPQLAEGILPHEMTDY